MAINSVKARNEKRKDLVNQNRAKRQALKEQIRKPKSIEEQQIAIAKLHNMPRDTSKVRLRNRCNETGRARGVYSRFKLTRHIIRHLMSLGRIPGLTKSSW